MSWRDKLQVEGMDGGDRSDTSSNLAMSIEVCVDTAEPSDEPERTAVSWPEWKAASLNKLFREQGITGQPGRITAATVRNGETGRERVDSAARDERPMSPAEVTE